MMSRVRWVGAFGFAALAAASACLAAEPAHTPGQGGVGGDVGASSFRFDRVLSRDWFGDYSDGAQNRFAFSGRFRYVVNDWLRWQIGPGLTWSAYRAHGITIPRDADAQFAAGTPVPLSHVRPGDLLFYEHPVVGHVAMYVGGGTLVHASTSGQPVKTASAPDGGGSDFFAAKRIVG